MKVLVEGNHCLTGAAGQDNEDRYANHARNPISVEEQSTMRAYWE